LIGDPRNDENTIVSQLQGLFLRFHNRTLADNPGLPFEDIQKLVRFHYQYVVLNDFLPRIIRSSVLNDLKTDGHYDQSKLKFFHWKNEPFLPVEEFEFARSEEHTSELQSRGHLVCRLLLEKK